MGYLINIMKSLLSLILPSNPSGSASRRFLKGGRKAFAFAFGQPAVLGDDGSERGLQGLLPDDTVTDSGTTVNLTSRVTYLTSTSTVTANLPLVAGELREIIVIKNGANAATVTKASADSSNIILSAAAVAGSTNSVATATAGRFLSDGTYWYRVS
jgi:hypothetical protein